MSGGSGMRDTLGGRHPATTRHAAAEGSATARHLAGPPCAQEARDSEEQTLSGASGFRAGGGRAILEGPFNSLRSTRWGTAIVYAHAGWAPGDGGELHVQPLEYEPTAPNPRAAGANTRFQGGAPQDGERTVVPPRGGTLVLFPSHLYHRVAAVTRASARYAVTAWLSLPERAEALGAGGSLAAELTSSGWVSASADHSRIRMLGGGATTAGRPLPGCAAAKSAVEGAQRRAMHALLA